ncbi:hypothetical protein SNE40_000945 [Patella caerulea]
MSPYITSYMRKYNVEKNLQYTDSVWIFACSGMGQGASMFLGGVLEKKIGPRLATLLGSLFMSLGVFLSYFTVKYSFPLLVLTYGLMIGLGIGVAYAVPMACAMRWLPDRRGLVNGFVVAGFGGGAFIFDQVQTAFINPKNQKVGDDKFFHQSDVLDKVPDCFLLLGGCYVAMQLLGCLLLSNPPQSESLQNVNSPVERRPILSSDENSPESSSDTDQDVSIVSPDVEVERTLSPGEMLQTREFYILWFILLLNGQGVLFISTLYKAYGVTFINDDVFLALVGSFAAVFNAMGRIMWGYLADKTSFKVAMVLLNGTFTILILTLGLTKLVGKGLFFVWVCLIFLTFSGNFSLMPTATSKSFGQAHYVINYGLVFTSQVVTGPIGAILPSQLQSSIGWYGLFFMVASFSFMSLLLTLLFKVKNSKGKDI